MVRVRSAVKQLRFVASNASRQLSKPKTPKALLASKIPNSGPPDVWAAFLCSYADEWLRGDFLVSVSTLATVLFNGACSPSQRTNSLYELRLTGMSRTSFRMKLLRSNPMPPPHTPGGRWGHFAVCIYLPRFRLRGRYIQTAKWTLPTPGGMRRRPRAWGARARTEMCGFEWRTRSREFE